MATVHPSFPLESSRLLRRIRVGGQWLNITDIVSDGAAEDPDSKIFICEACVARETPSELCNTANFTVYVVGAPPKIKRNLSEY